MYEYFYKVERVPEWNPSTSPGKLEKGFYRYYKWYLDFDEMTHLSRFSSMMIQLMKMERGNQVKCYSALDKLNVLPCIEEFCARRPEQALQPDYVDLYYLYSHVLETQPKVVLELGSGVSTVVITAALKCNGEGRLYSVDPVGEWADSTARSLPRELRNWCEVSYSDKSSANVGGCNTACFKTLPVEHADMIYLDAAHEGALFQGAETIHTMRQRFKGGETILIDGRWMAIEFFACRPALYDVISYANVVVNTTAKLIGPIAALDLLTNTVVTVRPPLR